MWQKAAHSLAEMLRLAGTSKEQRSDFSDTVSRLRQHTAAYGAAQAQAEAPAAESEYRTTETLFDAFSAPRAQTTPENRSVRHWIHGTSQASQSDKQSSKRDGWNDSTGLGADELNLQFFLTHTAKEKAVERFFINTQEHLRFAVDTQPDGAAPDNLFILKRLNRVEAEELMLRLGESNNPTVRAALASNKRTPVSVLWKLLEDPAQEVRLALLTNPNIPVPIVEGLCRDDDRKVSRRAQSHLRNIYKNEVGIAAGNLQVTDEDIAAEAELDSDYQGSLDDLETFLDGIAI